jgi:prolyl-tRNA synthetase
VPRCGSLLEINRGIEIGHVFQLGRKYADAFGLDVLGPDSKPVRVTMGRTASASRRAVAAIAEQSLRREGAGVAARGRAVDVHVVGSGKGEQKAEAERLGAALEERGLDRAARRPAEGLARVGLQGRRAASACRPPVVHRPRARRRRGGAARPAVGRDPHRRVRGGCWTTMLAEVRS